MSKATVHLKTETERGPLEFRVKIPDGHPIVSSLITYAVEMARPDSSQLPLFSEPKCSVGNCENKAEADGLCLAHQPYEEPGEPTAGDPEPEPPAKALCSVDGCEEPATKKTGMCRAHNKANRAGEALEAAKENGPKAVEAAENASPEPEPETVIVCSWAGCDRPTKKGSAWCAEHHRCEVDERCRVSSCTRKPYAHGLCAEHHCSNPACENIAGPAGACSKCLK